MKYYEHLYVGKVDESKRHALEESQAVKLEAYRQEVLKHMAKNRFKHYVSLCLIIRDENDYLEEWLRWHAGIGVEHFYIYDHQSKEPVRKFIRSLPRNLRKKITVIRWDGSHKDAQPDAYNDCLNRFGKESRWIGFVDSDEQVNIKTGQSLPEFLKGYEDYAGLYAIWVMYNANGQRYKTDKPLRERFTEITTNDAWSDSVGKIFVQSMLVREMYIHSGEAVKGFFIVDEHKNPVSNFKLSMKEPTTDLICIDHFYTKSYEEWMQKLRRGSCHKNFSRRYGEFFALNPDMMDCHEDIRISQQYEDFDTEPGLKGNNKNWRR